MAPHRAMSSGKAASTIIEEKTKRMYMNSILRSQIPGQQSRDPVLARSAQAAETSCQVIFKTRIYHCNVDAAGVVSLDILKDSWSPALTISKVLFAITAIFTIPDPYYPPDNPLVSRIARLYLTDRATHDEIAAEFTMRFAR